jgi:hypothetical protein
MEEQGVLILVTGVDCRYGRSASYDDEVTIRTRMGDVGSRGLSFFYEIVRSDDGTLLAEGSTRHVFVDGTGRPIRIPEGIHAAFEIRRRDSEIAGPLRFPDSSVRKVSIAPGGAVGRLPRLYSGRSENARSARDPGGVSADTSPPSARLP